MNDARHNNIALKNELQMSHFSSGNAGYQCSLYNYNMYGQHVGPCIALIRTVARVVLCTA